MAYLLDSCALSDYLKGDRNTIQRFKQEQPSNICISTFTVFEIEYGLQLKPSLIPKINPQLQAVYRSIAIEQFDLQDAVNAATLRAELKKVGTPIGAYDLLIAAMAISRGLTLVTSNLKEFSRVKDLQLENWRD